MTFAGDYVNISYSLVTTAKETGGARVGFIDASTDAIILDSRSDGAVFTLL
jgi:hypothetical protein